MTASIVTTATGLAYANTSSIVWQHEMEGPIGPGHALVAFVGGVDSQKPDPISATLSGTGVSPISEQALSTAVTVNGTGHGHFPCGWIFTLGAPVIPSGVVTGTITIEFDERVGRIAGMSAIISGTNGTIDNYPQSISQHTQHPEFVISGTYTTTGTNTVLVDMCMSESSNHQNHVVSGQTLFGDVFFSGPKYTLTYLDAPAPGTFVLSREEVGGPFAGVSLIIIGLESE
jgi:hypothetical protein